MKEQKIARKTQRLLIRPQNEGKPWNKAWDILLRKDEETKIGTVSFEGKKEYGTVPIYMELEEAYRNQGYGTEALKEMVRWAFGFAKVYEIEAVTPHANDKCVHALKKAGFIRRGEESAIETYSIKKPKTEWTGLYVLLGIPIGLTLSIVIGSPAFGFLLGMFGSTLIGVILDSNAAKERDAVTAGKE